MTNAPSQNNEDNIVEAINQILPQTQCRQCDFEGCKPYAMAISKGDVAINQCVPGGELVIEQLAALLGKPKLEPRKPMPQNLMFAKIDATLCIGCTKCIDACPTDAIVGAPKLMHNVIIDDCTGCELCIPACPMVCISLEPFSPIQTPCDISNTQKEKRKKLFEQKNERLKQFQLEKNQKVLLEHQKQLSAQNIKLDIQSALKRAKAKKEFIPYVTIQN